MSRFVLTPAAEGDLLKIIEYLEGDSPDAVLRVVDALDEAMQRLAVNPAIGHVRPDLTDQDVRFWPVFKYLVVYRPETNPLEIVIVGLKPPKPEKLRPEELPFRTTSTMSLSTDTLNEIWAVEGSRPVRSKVVRKK